MRTMWALAASLMLIGPSPAGDEPDLRAAPGEGVGYGAADPARRPRHCDDLGSIAHTSVLTAAARVRAAHCRQADGAQWCSRAGAVPCSVQQWPSRLTSPACSSRPSAVETDGRCAPTSWLIRSCVSGIESSTPPGPTRP